MDKTVKLLHEGLSFDDGNIPAAQKAPQNKAFLVYCDGCIFELLEGNLLVGG